MSSYYNQWDKEDTDSWQGKDWDHEEEIDEEMESEPKESDEDYQYDSMDSLGMSWSDFF